MEIVRKISMAAGILAVSSLGFSSSAYAAVTNSVIQNGNFSTVSGLEGAFNGSNVYSTADNWDVTNDVVFSGAESNGATAAIFNGGDQPAGNSISQTFSTTVGKTYDVSFDFGAFGNSTNQTLTATVDGDSSVLGSKSVNTLGNGTGGADLSPYFFSFVATGNATSLTFNDIGSTTSNVDGVLTNVAVTPVPEASTVALLSLALGFGFLMLRSRKQISQ